MQGKKVIFNGGNPKTQSIEAVEALAGYLKKPIEGGVLDLGAVKLVQSSKGDVYYVTTPRACSCLSASWRPGKSCKHMRKHFAMESKGSSPAGTSPSSPGSSRPKWVGGHNGPVLDEALAGGRSMLGDAPGRFDLSEEMTAEVA